MILKLVTPVPVSLNRLYVNQARYNPKTRSYVSTGKRILSKDGKKKKNQIQAEARLQMSKQNKWNYEFTKYGFIYQDVVIYFPRRGADPDNIFKLLNDSLEGIVFDNDSRVLTRVQKVLYDKNNPRVELTYTKVEFVGIFDSKIEATDFESNCMGCSRYLNGRCSILNDSLNGTIREEIDNDRQCTKYKKKKI